MDKAVVLEKDLGGKDELSQASRMSLESVPQCCLYVSDMLSWYREGRSRKWAQPAEP